MNRYFNNLDVVRTLLALMIALGHFFIWNGVMGIIPTSFYMAVDIFFVLSGFVLAQKTLHSHLTETSTFVKEFAIKRFFRLYPLYFLLFTICVLLQIWEFGKEIDHFRYFLMSIFLLQAMGFETNANHIFSDTTIGIGWSVSVELWMGMIFFPLLFKLKNNPKTVAIICAILAIATTALIILFSPHHLNVNLQRVAFLTFGGVRCITGLTLGCLSFFIFSFLDGLKSKQKLFFPILEIVIIAASVGCFFLKDKYHFIAPYIFSIAIPMLALNRGFISRFLSLEIFSSLRPISYGIYLVHPFYVYLFRKMPLPFNLQYSLLYAFLTITTAVILYKFIERPGINLGKRTKTHY